MSDSAFTRLRDATARPAAKVTFKQAVASVVVVSGPNAAILCHRYRLTQLGRDALSGRLCPNPQ